MKVTTTPGGRSTVVLDVEFPADRLQRQIEESIRHVSRRTRVPGFRPGHAPRPLLERTLGVRRGDPDAPDPIYDEAKEHLFRSSVEEALRESDVDPIAIPDPEWTSFSEGAGASYRLTLPVRPEVKLGAYTGYPFGLTIDTIDDAKVDQVIEQLRDQHASLVPVEGRTAQDGDYAVIAFEGRLDGAPFEGGAAERFPLVIGAERMIPGFEQQLVGMAEGESKSFPITFPDDYPDEALRGREAEFDVTLRELRAKQLPEADDDFARSLGSYDDLATLRAEIARRLEANARDRARHVFSDRVIEFAVANATVEVPELLVDREVEVMLDELRVRLAEQGIGYDEYLRVTERDEAALRTEYREPAEKRVKTLLVLSAIADQEGITVEEASVDAEIERVRTRSSGTSKLPDYFTSARGRAFVRTTLRRSQTVEALVDRWLAEHPEVGPVPHLEHPAEPRPEEESREP